MKQGQNHTHKNKTFNKEQKSGLNPREEFTNQRPQNTIKIDTKF